MHAERETEIKIELNHILTHVFIVICIVVFIGTAVRPGVILSIPLPERGEAGDNSNRKIEILFLIQLGNIVSNTKIK